MVSFRGKETLELIMSTPLDIVIALDQGMHVNKDLVSSICLKLLRMMKFN